MAAPSAYGGSQATGLIRAVAAGLHHSSWQRQILKPPTEARDRTCNLMVPSRIHFCCATTGTPSHCYWWGLLCGLSFGSVFLPEVVFISSPSIRALLGRATQAATYVRFGCRQRAGGMREGWWEQQNLDPGPRPRPRPGHCSLETDSRGWRKWGAQPTAPVQGTCSLSYPGPTSILFPHNLASSAALNSSTYTHTMVNIQILIPLPGAMWSPKLTSFSPPKESILACKWVRYFHTL